MVGQDEKQANIIESTFKNKANTIKLPQKNDEN